MFIAFLVQKRGRNSVPFLIFTSARQVAVIKSLAVIGLG